MTHKIGRLIARANVLEWTMPERAATPLAGAGIADLLASVFHGDVGRADASIVKKGSI